MNYTSKEKYFKDCFKKFYKMGYGVRYLITH